MRDARWIELSHLLYILPGKNKCEVIRTQEAETNGAQPLAIWFCFLWSGCLEMNHSNSRVGKVTVKNAWQ